MLELPTTPGIRTAVPRPIDFGIEQRPATGAATTYIDRPGTRFAVEFTLPPMKPDTARVFISRLLRGKAEGLRVVYPLSGVSQSTPGSPVVNGSGSGGTSLPVRNATTNYQAKEGWWLNVIDGDGVYYLHNVAADVTLSGGTGTLSVWPPIRADLSDGDTVVLDAPKIEGRVIGEFSWPLPHEKIVQIPPFVIEESE